MLVVVVVMVVVMVVVVVVAPVFCGWTDVVKAAMRMCVVCVGILPSPFTHTHTHTPTVDGWRQAHKQKTRNLGEGRMLA